jgi:putative ABC transport system permease protein
MSLWTLCLRSLRRRPLRSALTVAGLSAGVAALVALLALAGGLAASWRDVYRERRVDLVVINGRDADFLQSRVPELALDELHTRPEVEEADGVLVDLTSYDGVANTFISGRMPGSFVLARLQILEGRGVAQLPEVAPEERSAHAEGTGPPPPRSPEEREILIGEAFAEGHHKAVGDTVMVEEEPFRVVGIYRAGSLFENGGAVVHLKALQRFEMREGELTSIELRLRRPEDADSVASWLRQRFPQLQAQKPTLMVEQSFGLEIVEAMAWVVSVLALVVGLIGTSNTMLMSVLEQRRQIGILRALGWRGRRILALVMGETLALSGASYGLGCLAGAFATRLLRHLEATRNILEPRVDVSVLLQALGALLALSLVAALYPAYRASRISPMEAIRLP